MIKMYKDRIVIMLVVAFLLTCSIASSLSEDDFCSSPLAEGAYLQHDDLIPPMFLGIVAPYYNFCISVLSPSCIAPRCPNPPKLNHEEVGEEDIDSNDSNKNAPASVTDSDVHFDPICIYFDFDCTKIIGNGTYDPSSINQIKNNLSQFIIYGHTNKTGSYEYNVALGCARACVLYEDIEERLQQKISMDVYSLGCKEAPVSNDDDEPKHACLMKKDSSITKEICDCDSPRKTYNCVQTYKDVEECVPEKCD